MNGEQGQVLRLEVLNGPLDGATVTLEKETAWTRGRQGPLAFPWDEELGEPQAHFRPDENGWTLTGHHAAHGTHRINTREKVTSPIQLEKGDVLKASGTWFLVRATK